MPSPVLENIYSQLGHCAAINFRELDFQQDLLCPDWTEAQDVNHILRICASDLTSVFRDIFRGHVSGKNNSGPRGGNLNLLVRKNSLDLFLCRSNVHIDTKIEAS